MTQALDAMPAAELMRRARRAVRDEDFAAAARLYASLAAREEGRDDLDLRMRHAFCAERAGQLETALSVYRDLVGEYERRGEDRAAAALRDRLAGLKAAEEARASGPADALDVLVPPLSEAELAEALFAIGRRRRLQAGETLCREGDVPHGFWLLESGAIEVKEGVEDEVICVRRPEGRITLMGEVGYFTLQRRSATLVAAENAAVIEVQASAIAQRESEDPAFAGAMARMMRDKWLEPALARHEIFARINDVDRRRLADRFEPLDLRPGDVLVEQGGVVDAAFLLQQGCLFYMHEDGGQDRVGSNAERSPVVAGVMPGDVVHLGGLLQGYSSPYRIVAATHSCVLRLRADVFGPFLDRRPWLPSMIESFCARPAHRQLMRPDEPRPWHEGMTTLETMRSDRWEGM